MITLICALTKDKVIGKDGRLPWDIPEEMQHFRNTTKDSVIIMGRKTYESIGRPLPKRVNIVISSSAHEIQGCEVFHDIQSAVERAKSFGKEIFVIGGSTIFRQTLPFADKMILSWVKKYYPGDTFFPGFDEREWIVEKKEGYAEFDILYYQKKA
ncbi:dihydrofolate reductase [Candidatus Woesearchaeota archaeon]|nr:dihydrofolate reductase [Candidatus Woesearchaeota archaeon]